MPQISQLLALLSLSASVPDPQTLSACPLLSIIPPSSRTILDSLVGCPDSSAIARCLTVTGISWHGPLLSRQVKNLIPCLDEHGCSGTDQIVALCAKDLELELQPTESYGKGKDIQEKLDYELRRRVIRQLPDATDDPLADAAAATTDIAAVTSDLQQETPTDTPAEQSPTKTKKPAKTDAQTTAAAETSTLETTTAPTTQATTPSTLETQTSTPTTPAITAADSLTADPNAATCLATSFISTSFCGIISDSQGSPTTLPCVPTTTPSVHCAPGMLCQSPSAGGPISCMKREDKLTLSGLIVTIVFASAFAFAVAAFFWFLCRNKRAEARMKKMAAAKAIVSIQSHSQPKATEADDVVPLMSAQAPAGYGGGAEAYAAPGTGARTARTLQKGRPTSRGVSPLIEGEDVGYHGRP